MKLTSVNDSSQIDKMNIKSSSHLLPSFPKRCLSSSTHPCSSLTTTSSSSIQSKHLNSLPILIQLCFYPNEYHAYQTMKLFISSSNISDEFNCNLLMYTLRYQRYRLFDLLINDISLDLNLQAKDQQDNTILHYAVIYGNEQVIDKLCHMFRKFGISIDQRNLFGFTPLLLAVFCGRYDLALILLTKTDASPFVRDYVQLRNILDYIDIDTKQRDVIRQLHKIRRPSSQLTRKSIRLRLQLHQTLPSRSETINKHHHHYKNFFEHLFPQAVRDRSGSIRSSISTHLSPHCLSTDLIHYLNERYPRINTPRTRETITKLPCQIENYKTNVHTIFTLFDPNLRSKAVPPPPPSATLLERSSGKTPMSFKRLGTKITLMETLSRRGNGQKSGGIRTMTAAK